MKDSFRLNEEEAVSKVFDGEAVIINISNGMYYSLDQVGALIWELLVGGHSLEAIVEAVVANYDVSSQQAQTDVEKLGTELCHENLLAVSSDNPVPLENLTSAPKKLPYVSAKLNVYRDMGDLLALDPPMPGLENTPWKEPDDEPPR